MDFIILLIINDTAYDDCTHKNMCSTRRNSLLLMITSSFTLSLCTPSTYVAYGCCAACLINSEYNTPALFFSARGVKLCQLLCSVIVQHLPSIWKLK